MTFQVTAISAPSTRRRSLWLLPLILLIPIVTLFNLGIVPPLPTFILVILVVLVALGWMLWAFLYFPEKVVNFFEDGIGVHGKNAGLIHWSNVIQLREERESLLISHYTGQLRLILEYKDGGKENAIQVGKAWSFRQPLKLQTSDEYVESWNVTPHYQEIIKLAERKKLKVELLKEPIGNALRKAQKQGNVVITKLRN